MNTSKSWVSVSPPTTTLGFTARWKERNGWRKMVATGGRRFGSLLSMMDSMFRARGFLIFANFSLLVFSDHSARTRRSASPMFPSPSHRNNGTLHAIW